MTSLDDVKGFLVNWVKEAVEEVITDVEAAGEEAKDAMYSHIEVSGTMKEWVGDYRDIQEAQGRLPADRTESVPGRDHTGTFKESIDVTTERNSDGAEVRVGWPEDRSERDEYFTLQEHGFDDIKGVHSLQVAIMVAEERLKQGGAKWRML